MNVVDHKVKASKTHLALQLGSQFPLSPHPENPGKLLKNFNLAQPGPVLKLPKITQKTEQVLKVYFLRRGRGGEEEKKTGNKQRREKEER